jgi:hypothetical protein
MASMLLVAALIALPEPAGADQPAQTSPAPASPVPASQAPASQPPAATPVPAPVPVNLSDAGSARLRLQMLEKDRADLVTAIAGRWDNEVQVFFEPEIGVPVGERHTRIHVAIRPLPAGGFAGPAFYVEHMQGGETGAVVRQQVWVFTIDGQANAVRMAPLAPKDPASVEGAWMDDARIAAITADAFTPVEGCEILWRRRGAGFSGETRPGACRLGAPGDERAVLVSERHDLSGGTWDVRDIGVDARGTRVFGVPDGSPARYRKARTFSCWLRGSGQAVADVAVHDQGGVGQGAGLPGLRLRLRNIEWPLGNSRPSLTLYLLTSPGEIAETFAWTDPQAQRIAVALRGAEASCTEDTALLWRVGQQARDAVRE